MIFPNLVFTVCVLLLVRLSSNADFLFDACLDLIGVDWDAHRDNVFLSNKSIISGSALTPSSSGIERLKCASSEGWTCLVNAPAPPNFCADHVSNGNAYCFGTIRVETFAH